MAGLAAAFGSGAMTNSIREIGDAEVLFVIGSNTTEAHPVISYNGVDRDQFHSMQLIDQSHLL